MPWLYDPEKVTTKEPLYNVYIHSEDMMFSGFTYREIINQAIANCKKPVTEMALRFEIMNLLNIRMEDMWAGFEMCKTNMLKEINKE